jgi:hypothetical protein
MRINRHHITAILATGAAAVAIAAAPTASAAPTLTEQSCAADGAGTECQSPGNVQIYDSPPPVDIDPYGGYGLALGGFGYGGGFHGYGGGFHGGGGGFHGGGGGHR